MLAVCTVLHCMPAKTEKGHMLNVPASILPQEFELIAKQDVRPSWHLTSKIVFHLTCYTGQMPFIPMVGVGI